MSRRFFVESEILGDRAFLTGSEAHHLSHVLRMDVGQHVTLFDGKGAEFTARIGRVHRSRVDLEVLDRAEISRELSFELILGVALPKGDRQRWLIEKAVELGVARVVPLITERGVAQPVETATARLRRAVIEASKQCGRNQLMEISGPQSISDYVQTVTDSATRLMAHRSDDVDTSDDVARLASTSGQHQVYIAVGPEGGFSPQEANLAEENGWKLVSLGPRTLRVDTAALTLVALVATPEN